MSKKAAPKTTLKPVPNPPCWYCDKTLRATAYPGDVLHCVFCGAKTRVIG